MAGRPARKQAMPTSKIAELQIRFGANLRQARREAELTQAALAALAGIRQAYVSKVESGAHNLTLGTMVALADAVGVEVSDLLDCLRWQAVAAAAPGREGEQ